MRRGAKPAKAKVEAKLPVPRESLKNEGSRVRDLEKRLAEAQEQQTATSEILRVISGSPTDVQPVFDAIAEWSVRLCQAVQGGVGRFDGELIHVVSQHNNSPETESALQSLYPRPPGRETAMTRAILERTVVHIPDVRQDPEYDRGYASRTTARSALAVPMLRDGSPIGAIAVSRPMPGPFSDKQIALLQTFAAQAVIAIENVRLFNETKEALEQQTATADILRVISSSPTDLQPVMDAVAESAARLCGADNVVVFRSEGGILRPVAVRGSRLAVEIPISRGAPSGRAAIDRETVHIPDLLTALDEYPEAAPVIEQTGSRAILVAPLVKKGEAVGTITIRRDTPGPFTHKQVKLLKTFADQAVIAIENARLFQELQATNRDLTEALEQQTATSDVLKVISRSTFDLQPVLETVTESAVRLCGGERALIFRFDGEVFRVAATQNVSPELREFVERHPLRARERHGALRTRAPNDPHRRRLGRSRVRILGERDGPVPDSAGGPDAQGGRPPWSHRCE